MSETATASAPFAVEHDLNSVVRRFSSWKNRHEAPDHSQGLRDLTYEEAARSSRFKHTSLAHDRDHVLAASVAACQAEKKTFEPDATLPGSEDLKLTEGDPKRRSLHPKSTCAGMGNCGSKLPAAEVRELLRSAVASLAQTKPALAAHAQPDPSLTPTFASALIRASRSEMLADVSGHALSSATEIEFQTVPLTLPTADWELIRTRALEASLPIPDYVRQCALEVEQLRALVDRALKAVRTAPAAALSVKLDEAISTPLSLPLAEISESNPEAKAAHVPAGMLTRLGSLFGRRGTRLSVTA